MNFSRTIHFPECCQEIFDVFFDQDKFRNFFDIFFDTSVASKKVQKSNLLYILLHAIAFIF